MALYTERMGHSSLVGGHLDHTNSSKKSLILARGEQVDVEKVASKTRQKPVMVSGLTYSALENTLVHYENL